jgi:hypothetical protein
MKGANVAAGGIAGLLAGDGAILWLLRAVSLFLLFLALRYWITLTGASGGDLRFDTMPQHWRLAASVLAVSLPVASLGLWAGSSWGLVLWFPIIAAEIVMYVLMSDLFGAAPVRVAVHLAAALLYLFLAAMRFYYRRRMVKAAAR